ncbi:hypothetical protein GCM10017687_02170 [Streptomyces echinatus]
MTARISRAARAAAGADAADRHELFRRLFRTGAPTGTGEDPVLAGAPVRAGGPPGGGNLRRWASCRQVPLPVGFPASGRLLVGPSR